MSDEREEHDWRTVVEMRRLYDHFGSMRGMYLWIGLASGAIGVGNLVRSDGNWKTTTLGIVLVLTATAFLLGRWRVRREPRLWTMLLASIYTVYGAVSVFRYFLGDETLRGSGVLYHYVIGLVLVLGLWSVVPRRKTLEFLARHREEWHAFLSKKRPEWM